MDLQLAGRTAVVTGGASGIGREVARTLAGEGARVVVADVNATGLDETLAGLKELDLSRTKVTGAGAQRLREALPGCRVEFGQG